MYFRWYLNVLWCAFVVGLTDCRDAYVVCKYSFEKSIRMGVVGGINEWQLHMAFNEEAEAYHRGEHPSCFVVDNFKY